jgi:AraC-like DNA-binding protein
MHEATANVVDKLEIRLFLQPLSDLVSKMAGDRRLARTWLLVKNDYADPRLSLNRAARAAGASKNHLNLLMRNSVSLTFHQFLLRYRVFMAAVLIGTTDRRNTLEIALSTGFGTLRSFEKNFRRLLGCSPRSYKIHGIRGEASDPNELRAH